MDMLKLITPEEANEKLGSVGLTLSQWKGIANKDGQHGATWRKTDPPRESSKLFHFCDEMATTLSKSDWVIIQVDLSSNFPPSEDRYLAQIIFGRDSRLEVTPGATIYLSASNKSDGIDSTLIRDIIFFFLMFEQHCYIATSQSDSEGYIGIQDGEAYFIRKDSVDGYIDGLQ